jgi:hypothetical protein
MVIAPPIAAVKVIPLGMINVIDCVTGYIAAIVVSATNVNVVYAMTVLVNPGGTGLNKLPFPPVAYVVCSL